MLVAKTKLKHFGCRGFFAYNLLQPNGFSRLPINSEPISQFSLPMACGPIMTESTLSTHDINNNYCNYVSSHNYRKVNDMNGKTSTPTSLQHVNLIRFAYVMPDAGPLWSNHLPTVHSRTVSPTGIAKFAVRAVVEILAGASL